MGERGPAPRREAEVRRTNNKGTAEKLGHSDLQDLPFTVDLAPDPGEAPGHWQDVLAGLWDALRADPVRKWMTSADWAATKLVFETFNRSLSAVDKEGNAVDVSANMLGQLLTHLHKIGVTEDARLRLRKEITLFPVVNRGSDDGEVVDIRDARKGSVQ